MDVIGELLRANMLQQVGDDEQRVKRLRQAANALAENFASAGRNRLPSALLSAIDSTSNANTPMLRMTREALLEVWETLGNAFPDQPLDLYRAVLLEAAVIGFMGDAEAAAAGWYSLRNVLQLLDAGRWEPVLRKLLEEWDAKTGAAAERSWAAAPQPEGLEEREPDEAEEASPLPTGATETQSAAGARATAILQAGTGTYNTQFTSALYNNFPAFVDDLSSDMRVIADVALREAVERMNRSAQLMEEAIRAAGLRTELLWWRSTAYSSGRRRRYRELTSAQAVIAAVLDVHHMVDRVSPVSVEHVLFDTIASSVDGEVSVNDLANCTWSAELRREIDPAEGTFLAAVTLGTDTPLSPRGALIPPADAAVLLFRDLQAAHLLSRRETS